MIITHLSSYRHIDCLKIIKWSSYNQWLVSFTNPFAFFKSGRHPVQCPVMTGSWFDNHDIIIWITCLAVSSSPNHHMIIILSWQDHNHIIMIIIIIIGIIIIITCLATRLVCCSPNPASVMLLVRSPRGAYLVITMITIMIIFIIMIMSMIIIMIIMIVIISRKRLTQWQTWSSRRTGRLCHTLAVCACVARAG